jgi:phage repressor protein C with HTH and peptisase S24 domain
MVTLNTMFKLGVNKACNTSCLDRPIIAGMHIQMERLYRAAKELKNIGNQAELARALNQSSQTVNNWEARGISKTGLLLAQTEIGCSVTWLTTGEGPMIVGAPSDSSQDADGFITTSSSDAVDGAQRVRVGGGPETIPVRAVKLRLQAGVSGFMAEPDLDVDHGYFQVPTYVIEKLQLNPANLIIMSVAGRSMEPMYFEDDKVLVDTSKVTPKNNECFAVNWNGEPIVKCLIRKANDWCLYSFNHKFPSMSVRSGQCSIIGQVVWQPDRIVVGRL